MNLVVERAGGSSPAGSSWRVIRRANHLVEPLRLRHPVRHAHPRAVADDVGVERNPQVRRQVRAVLDSVQGPTGEVAGLEVPVDDQVGGWNGCRLK